MGESRLKIQRTHIRGGWRVALRGIADEGLDAAALTGDLRGVVVYDLEELDRMTSLGIRLWVAALESLEASYYCFIHAGPLIVVQFNTVANFAGRGELVSFYCPYVCPRCGAQKRVLVDLRVQYGEVGASEPPQAVCDACLSATEFDDVPDAYFGFVSERKQPNPPALANDLIDGGQARRAEPLRMEKDVTALVTALSVSGGLHNERAFKHTAEGLEGEVVLNFDGLTSHSDPGVAAIAALAQRMGPSLFFARVPKELILSLASRPEACGAAKVISVLVPYVCEDCEQMTELPIDADECQEVVAFPGRCMACGGSTWPEADLELKSALAKLPVAPPSSAIRAYLAGAPTVDLQEPTAETTAVDRHPASGKYKVLRTIKTGGMAEVLLAQMSTSDGFHKEVAIKRLLPHLAEQEFYTKMFLDEARMLARLSHPNIVQVFDLGRNGREYYMVMEYIRGWDLAQIVRRVHAVRRQIPMEIIARIGADLCSALQVCHGYVDEHGRPSPVIHRDVSPTNILVSTDGVMKLVDFGIAKTSASPTTGTGKVKGKLSYLAPERLSANLGPSDARSDIFSVGIILYECVTLKRLFYRESEAQTLDAVLHQPAPPVSQYRADVPADFQALLDRALKKDPAERYSTARELQGALEHFLSIRGWPVPLARIGEWLGHLFGAPRA